MTSVDILAFIKVDQVRSSPKVTLVIDLRLTGNRNVARKLIAGIAMPV